MELKLYFISCKSDEDDFDLFVWASSIEQAQALHQGHFNAGFDYDESLIFELPTIPPDEPKALAWHIDIKEVGQ